MTEFERYWQNCAPCGALGKSLTVKCDRTTPRRFLVYCGDYKCAHWVVIAAAAGAMTCGCPTLNPSSLVRFAAIEPRISDRCSNKREWEWAASNEKRSPQM
jgi:hypothetical protein